MEFSEKQSEKTVLKFLKTAPGVYRALHELKRTGWIRRGLENPESVKEHTESLVKLVNEISGLLSDEEKDGLADMLEVHDWPEAIDGDPVNLELDPVKRKVITDSKFEREKEALKFMCADIANGQEIMDLWLRFETSDDPAAVLGRQMDKYQAVEKALEFELEQNVEVFEDFYHYALNFIDHPVLLERINDLKLKWGK